jgi:hypothetical protein
MYNVTIAQNLGLYGTDPLYKLVEDGKWTFDKFTELCRAAAYDLNGNGIVDGAEDRFGIVTVDWLSLAILGGFGETLVSKDGNDLPYLACDTERFFSGYEKMTEFMSLRDIVVREHIDYNGPTEDVFVNDRALFCGEVLSCVRLFRDMGSDFAILPLPKYDELQDNYYTYTLISTIIAIPVTNPNPSRTGHILEALSAESRRLVIPAYYDIALGAKYLRDEGSIRMLDIILENKIYDIANGHVMYNWGGIADSVGSFSQRGETNFAVIFERHEDRANAAIQATIDAYNEISGN